MRPQPCGSSAVTGMQCGFIQCPWVTCFTGWGEMTRLSWSYDRSLPMCFFGTEGETMRKENSKWSTRGAVLSSARDTQILWSRSRSSKHWTVPVVRRSGTGPPSPDLPAERLELGGYLLPGVFLHKVRGVSQHDRPVPGERLLKAATRGVAEREVLHPPHDQRRPVSDL